MKSLSYKITGVVASLMLAATAVSAQTVPADTAQPQAETPPASTTPNTPVNPAERAAPSVIQETVTQPDGTTTTETITPQAEIQADTQTQATADAAGDTSAKVFVRDAFLANEFGIAAAQVALKNSEDAEVKAVAQRILTDGQTLRASLIAAVQGATTDVQFDQNWTDEHRQQLSQLSGLAGAEFDAKYLEIQGAVTADAATAYSQYSEAGTDASVKGFAQTALPMIEAQAEALDSVSQGGN